MYNPKLQARAIYPYILVVKLLLPHLPLVKRKIKVVLSGTKKKGSSVYAPISISGEDNLPVISCGFSRALIKVPQLPQKG